MWCFWFWGGERGDGINGNVYYNVHCDVDVSFRGFFWQWVFHERRGNVFLIVDEVRKGI